MSAVPIPETGELRPIDWDRIHRQTHALLEPLVGYVQRQQPTVRSQGGTTQTPALPLFSYRVFRWGDEPDLEAVIVGLDFKPSPNGGIVVRGDIGGEETGRTYYQAGEHAVAGTMPAVLAAAVAIASELAAQGDVVVSALRVRQPAPDYRGSPR